MPEPLSATDVRRVASLARLALTDAEVEEYRVKLSAVVAYVERLSALDLEHVEPLANVAETGNRLRADVPGPTLPTSTLMAMAPDQYEGFVRVPKVLDDGSSA